MNTLSPLSIGIIGLNFGRHVIEQLKLSPAKDYFKLAAVCDIDAAKATRHAEANQVKAYTSIDALLADDSIAAIGLFTGPTGRAELLHRIIHAGKDVITTKPFENDPDAALKVLKEAQRIGRVIHLNSPGPTPPKDIAQILAWANEYQLGAPVGVRGDVWANYRETADGSWYDDPVKCPAAPVLRLGIYLINDLIQLFGPVDEVNVLQSRLFTGRPTADNAQLSLRFENGALGNIFASFCINDGDHYRNTLVLNYEQGTIYRNAGPERSSDLSELSLVMHRDGQRTIVDRATVGGVSGSYQWASFFHAIKGEKPSNETTPEQIVAGLRVVSAMTEAVSTLD